MEETKKPKVTRSEIYRSENVISETLGEHYNPIICHRMKEKDTFKTVFPSTDIWKSDILLKSTNQVLKPTSYVDPHHDKRYFFKMDANKKYNEEMARAKNIMANTKKEEKSEEKK